MWDRPIGSLHVIRKCKIGQPEVYILLDTEIGQLEAYMLLDNVRLANQKFKCY